MLGTQWRIRRAGGEGTTRSDFECNRRPDSPRRRALRVSDTARTAARSWPAACFLWTVGTWTRVVPARTRRIVGQFSISRVRLVRSASSAFCAGRKALQIFTNEPPTRVLRRPRAPFQARCSLRVWMSAGASREAHEMVRDPDLVFMSAIFARTPTSWTRAGGKVAASFVSTTWRPPPASPPGDSRTMRKRSTPASPGCPLPLFSWTG